jgi:hypothetical protein
VFLPQSRQRQLSVRLNVIKLRPLLRVVAHQKRTGEQQRANDHHDDSTSNDERSRSLGGRTSAIPSELRRIKGLW